MSSLALAQALWSIAFTIWFLISLFVYVALIRQISIRAVPVGENAPKRFGIPEAVIALLLMSLLVLNLMSAQPPTASDIGNEDLIKNFILTGVVVFVLLAFLVFRGFDLDALAGLSKVGIVRAVAIAAIDRKSTRLNSSHVS